MKSVECQNNPYNSEVKLHVACDKIASLLSVISSTSNPGTTALVDEVFDELFNGKENDHIESEVHDVMIVKVTCGVYRMPNSIDSLAEILKKYVRGLTHINILRGLGKLY
nr:12581_t:CDS:2 [Entrophospora candida]